MPCYGRASYWCLWCKRELAGEPVFDEDGELQGYVFVHDDVPHPVDATYDEEEHEQ